MCLVCDEFFYLIRKLEEAKEDKSIITDDLIQQIIEVLERNREEHVEASLDW